jgi:hypothetical protein
MNNAHFPIGMGEAEPGPIREGGRWSDILATPVQDYDDPDRPVTFEQSPCSCAWCKPGWPE